MTDAPETNIVTPESNLTPDREFTLGLTITGVWTISYSFTHRPDLAGKPGYVGNAIYSLPVPETEILEVNLMISLYGLDQPEDEPPIMHLRTLNHFHIPGMKQVTEGENVYIPKNLMERITYAAHDTARGLILARNADTPMAHWTTPLLNAGIVQPLEKWPGNFGEMGIDVIRLSTVEMPETLEEKIRKQRLAEREATQREK